MSEVRGGDREDIPHPPKPEARGSGREELPHAPKPKARASGQEEQPMPKARGGGQEELPHAPKPQGQGWRREGATPQRRPGVVAGRTNPMSNEPWLRMRMRA